MHFLNTKLHSVLVNQGEKGNLTMSLRALQRFELFIYSKRKSERKLRRLDDSRFQIHSMDNIEIAERENR